MRYLVLIMKLELNFEQDLYHGDNRAALKTMMEAGILSIATDAGAENARLDFAEVKKMICKCKTLGIKLIVRMPIERFETPYFFIMRPT